jgi:hypothetical protein
MRLELLQNRRDQKLATAETIAMPREKKFKLPADQIRRLIRQMGGCFATDYITVDGLPVGYMYREAPGFDVDSGWRFFSGEETDQYTNDPDNSGIYEVNTIANYDPAIIPFLSAPIGSAFGRVSGTDQFERVPREAQDSET